jgi:hypothetical protein
MLATDQARQSAPAHCPVCGRPAGVDTQCEECGWILRSQWHAGPITAQAREEFTLRLHGAQHALDLRIAARIAADAGPYHRYIRGGPPEAAEWAAARRAAVTGLGDVADEALLRARLTEIASSLRTDKRSALVEVGRDGIAVCQAGQDRSGTPWLDRDPVISWTARLPMLSAAGHERYFQLAGGFGQIDRTTIRERVRDCLDGIPPGDLLVICRPAGWPVLEWATAAIVAARPGASLLRMAESDDPVPAAAMLASLTTEAPLRVPYQLMVAVVDHVSGAVRTEARQVFSPGDSPGTESSLVLRRPPGDGQDTALAIFSDDGSPDDPLALYSVPLPSQRVFDVRMVLDGPGRVRIAEPSGAAEHSQTWAGVRGEIPDQVSVTLGPTDLVCAVDLCGPRDGVRQRLRLIQSLLATLEDEYPESDSLRVAILTCRDHNFERGRERVPVVQGIRPGPVAGALAYLARQEPARVTYEPAAPIEDLLHEASIMLGESSKAGRATRLLLVGGRRPHSPESSDKVMRCPLKYRWREILHRLTGLAGGRCVAVADTKPDSPAQLAIWQSLGSSGLRWLSDASGQLVGEDLALLASHAQQIPIPLANPE